MDEQYRVDLERETIQFSDLDWINEGDFLQERKNSARHSSGIQ